MTDNDTSAEKSESPEEKNEQPQGEATEQADVEKPQGPDWKAQSRKHEARAKESQAELKKLKDAMSQMLSPDQIADKDAALAAANQRAAEAELKATRLDVALAEGLPRDLAVRLVGTTEEELREDAVRLKELVKAPTAVVDAKKGTNPSPQADPPNANDLLRQIVAGKR